MAGDPASIAGRIAEGSGNDISNALPPDDQGPSAEGGGEPGQQPAPIKTEDITKLLDERLKPLQDQLAEKDQELAFLRGSYQTLSQRPALPAVAVPPTPQPKSYLEGTPPTEVLEGLR